MIKLFCVRFESGTDTKQFAEGGSVAIISPGASTGWAHYGWGAGADMWLRRGLVRT